jgi:hypothetical protein
MTEDDPTSTARRSMVPAHSFVAAAVAALVTVAACGSRSGSGAARAPAPIVVTDERDAALSAALGERIISDDPTVGEWIAAPSGQVYQALVAVYSELGIPATVVNPSTGLVASVDRRVVGRLSGTNLSRYLSCGTTMTGPRADQDRVVLSVVSRVKPEGADKSRVETRVVATATGTSGTSDRLPCTTTGELEARVHNGVKAALGL